MLSCSVVSNSLHQAPLFFTISWSFLKFTFTKSVMPSKHLILCCPVLLPSIFQSFPASRSFPMSLFFSLGAQSIGASASTSVLSVNIQVWFPLGWTGLISLQAMGLSRVFSSNLIKSINSLALSLLYGPTLTSGHDYWKKNIALTIPTFVGKVMSLLFNMLSNFVIAFLPRSKHLLFTWL